MRLPPPSRVALASAAVLVASTATTSVHSQVLPSSDPRSAPSPALGLYADELAFVARQVGLPAHWLSSVMHAESNGNAGARSPKGAVGLMQLMPRTYAEMRLRLGLGADPWRPIDNLIAGASYLRMLTDRYGASGGLAAYNAGPRRYERWLAGVALLPRETQAYIARVRSDRPMTVPRSIRPPRKTDSASAPLFATVVRSSSEPAPGRERFDGRANSAWGSALFPNWRPKAALP